MGLFDSIGQGLSNVSNNFSSGINKWAQNPLNPLGGLQFTTGMMGLGGQQQPGPQLNQFPGGMPVAPSYNDPTGKMEGIMSQWKYDADPYNKLKTQAMSEGPSPWMKLQQQGLEQQTQQARDQLAGSVRANTAGTLSNLAMRGGLSSGARERANRAGLEAGIMGNQNISAQNAQNLTNLGIADEQQKNQILMNMPSMNAQLLNPLMSQAGMYGNLANARNAWNAQNYATQMGAYGANESANAMLANQPKQGLLGQITSGLGLNNLF